MTGSQTSLVGILNSSVFLPLWNFNYTNYSAILLTDKKTMNAETPRYFDSNLSYI